MNDDDIRNQDLKDQETNIDPTDCMIVIGLLTNLKYEPHHQKIQN
jgi:hypothetical protein